MKMQKKIAIVGTFIVLLFGITVANSKLTNAADSVALKSSESSDLNDSSTSEWTILIYMNADNNLESSAIRDFLEMAYIGSDSNVNIVLQIDRSPYSSPIYGYSSEYGDWASTKRYRVSFGATPTESCAILDLGELNMGDPATLSDLITWGTSTYPANRYAVILWNSIECDAEGLNDDPLADRKSTCWDQSNGNDCLTPYELKLALTTAGVHFDLIGFDASYMASTEIDYQIKDWANIRVSSEEFESSSGWPYHLILSDLESSPSMNEDDLAQIIIDRYVEYYQYDWLNWLSASLSAVRISQEYSLASAIDYFINLLSINMYSYKNQITDARAVSQEPFYAKKYVDLYHFCLEIFNRIPNQFIRMAAADVMNAINSMVIAEGYGLLAINLYGSLIYFPSTSEEYDSDYYYDLDFVTDHSWDEFLQAYYGVINVDDNYEENNNYTQAYDLTSYEEVWINSINGYGKQFDEDWYQIYASAGETFYVDCMFSHAEGDINIALINSGLISVASSASLDDDENLAYLVPESGTYYVKVYFGNAGNEYNLIWYACKEIADVNYEILLNVLNSKISEYNRLGYFKQVYQPSLQATYYALYALQAIDKLDAIDTALITDYIMSNYDAFSRVFIDDYAHRYLDSDFSKKYYALTTFLEVNCYAILSLEILNQLSLIDKQSFVDFIWSCYNPTTSGFIGQPYTPNLNEYFRTSTLDNTYYAIKTLNVLTDWSLYPDQKSDLVNFINGLQSTFPWEWQFGGFLNDYNTNFVSLYGFDTNLFSCYYAIKSLEIFNLIPTINLDNFHLYLSGLYDPSKSFFRIDYATTNNDTNLAATAIGLELSKLTQYTECDMNGVVNFLLNHRNSYGTWDCSTQSKNRELIDAFEIIRSLKDAGEISSLSLEDKAKIATTIQKFFHYTSFSLVSNDYLSVNLIYTIVNSFDLRDKISYLPIAYLYDRILNSSIYGTVFNYLSFHSCVALCSSANFEFRSKPLEYYTDLEHEYVLDNNKKISHKSTYYALDSLLKLFKLDDFALKYNLSDLVKSIINSQFLDSEYENYGAYLPSLFYQDPNFNSEFRNGEIEFKYSYYAIKALELLSGYLGLGKVKDLGININALFTYLNRRIIITPNFIYFCDNDYDTVENKIQKTYFMAYVLKTLEVYSLDNQKIKNFVEQNLDYSNVKNIYYSWKISELLSLNISFDLRRSHDLVVNIYDEASNEFYLTTDREKISQEAFLWIQEMAVLDLKKIDCAYKDRINPGSKNNVNVSLSNIVLSYFGPTITVKYESEKIGTIILKKNPDKNTYSCEILVSNDLYRSIEGKIVIYDGVTKIAEKNILFYVNEITPSPTPPSSSASKEDTIDAKGSTNHNDEKIDNAIPLVIALLAFPATVITISYKMKRDSFIESDKK